MARIIYKKGCEGQNWLESIEGIEIGLLNGQRALIYPKYAERVLLEREKINRWRAPKETEIEALKVEDTYTKTVALLNADSPAAEFVAQFRSDKHGIFALPSLLAAMEIQYQMDDIDALAETIEGADLLSNFTSYVWSCSRHNEDYGWIMNGYNGLSSYSGLHHSLWAVPTILYR